MKRIAALLALALIALATIQCAPAPQSPTTAPLPVVPTSAPTSAPPPAVATQAPPTNTSIPATPTVAGLPASEAEKTINDKLNNLDRSLALWNIQPGLGTVMVEYGNRLARMLFAANAGNWDMAKYQHDEMTEIQEVGETTRPGRAPMLKAFEDNFLKPIDDSILAKDPAKFKDAFQKAIDGCNACHKASTAANWKSYQYVHIQTPKIDPASYVDWKGLGQGNYITNPPTAAPAATKASLGGVLDAQGVQKLLADKLNKVDRSLTLWNIQPGLGTVMIEYGNRWSRLWFSAHAGNWDMAKYQHDEMIEIQEVGETTRPGRAPMLKAFEDNYLTAVDKAIAAKDVAAFEDAYKKAADGCNACHKASTSSNWKSYQYVKIQVPTRDDNDYIQWNSPKGTGNYIANPTIAPTATPKALTGPLDSVGLTKLISDTLGTVNRSYALWNIQPGLGTVMIEYARRAAQVWYSIEAGNWDMAKYQLDEMREIQEVGETTRPGRAPMLKAFESNFLDPLDTAILANDKTKAEAAFKSAVGGCNACHVASKGDNWSSYAYVLFQLPKTDPADYVLWATQGGTGNYIANPATGTPAATSAAGAIPLIPKDHAGRTTCLVCHQTGVNGAKPVPADHAGRTDDICLACHKITQ